MPTIKDVARRAGVSVSTVSRVLNNHPHVGQEVRERVHAVIQELHYEPSRVAQRLRATESRLVGVIFSDIANPFYIDVLQSIEHTLSRQAMSVLISNADSDPDREEAFIRIMLNENIAGLIIAPTKEDVPALAVAASNGLPIVVVDRRLSNVDVDTVLVDNFKGALAAVQHLIELGHTRIGVLSGPLHLTSGRERYTGYLQAMSDAGLTVDSSLTRFGNYRESSGYELTQELLTSPAPPSALFVANNLMAIGALNAIHQLGCKIPDEVAIIGFDDLPWAISLNPPLTTVAQPTSEIGTRAAELLLDRIKDRTRTTRTIVLPTQLRVRASCGSQRP
jgi:LacI family transcriptional regulator